MILMCVFFENTLPMISLHVLGYFVDSEDNSINKSQMEWVVVITKSD